MALADDFGLNANKIHISLLLLLDLSAVDHVILLRHLVAEVVVRGCALDWFK